MHLKLTEGNGIAALAEPIMDFPRTVPFGNATSVLGSSQSLIVVTDEQWLEGDIVAIIRPMNRSLLAMDDIEEARILSHPDVVAAIDAALPDIEAWERTL
jgi:hypothetical protein